MAEHSIACIAGARRGDWGEKGIGERRGGSSLSSRRLRRLSILERYYSIIIWPFSVLNRGMFNSCEILVLLVCIDDRELNKLIR